MAINSYDDNKITKGGIWVTIMKASSTMSFNHTFVPGSTAFSLPVAVAVSQFTHSMYFP